MVSKGVGVARENWLLFTSIVLASGVFLNLPQLMGAMLAFFFMPVLMTQLAVKAYEAALYGNQLGARPNVDGFTLAMKAASLIVTALFLRGFATASLLIGYNGTISNSEIDPLGDAIFSLSLCYILSYLGTWLPAAVHQVNPRFLAAAVRGNKTFLPVFIRLVFYTLIWRCVLFALPYGLLALGRHWQMDRWDQFVVDYLFYVVEAALSAFLMIVYAFVLTKYYLQAEGIGTVALPVVPVAVQD